MLPNSVTSRFPNRRRAAQACVACRMRKTRCDAAQPRCGFCDLHNIDCVYRDAQQPRIDYNTQVLLERIQLLEDRLTGQSHSQPPVGPANPPAHKGDDPVAELDVQIALSHTANANHVYTWPLVQQLISEATLPDDRPKGDATDVFFDKTGSYQHKAPTSWSLFDITDPQISSAEWRELIDYFFSEVNVFFPLLSKPKLLAVFDTAIAEKDQKGDKDNPSQHNPTDHALLLLVLCLGALVRGSGNIIHNSTTAFHSRYALLEGLLWAKAKLLLGFISADISMTSAQCAMLARCVENQLRGTR